MQTQDAEALDAAAAIEVYNHTCQVNSERGDGLVLYDDMLSRGHRLNCIAVDDSHFKADDAFGGWVMIKAENNEPDALLSALKAGHFYATQGPEIKDIRREDDHLVIECSPASSVMLLGKVCDNAAQHGRNLTRVRLPLDKFKDGWCRAVVVDAMGHRAWSNPLWLDQE